MFYSRKSFKLACWLCEQEMRTGAPTPGSAAYARRQEELTACAALGPRVQMETVGVGNRMRLCDVCGKSLGWGQRWWINPYPTDARAEGNDLCEDCTVLPRARRCSPRARACDWWMPAPWR